MASLPFLVSAGAVWWWLRTREAAYQRENKETGTVAGEGPMGRARTKFAGAANNVASIDDDPAADLGPPLHRMRHRPAGKAALTLLADQREHTVGAVRGVDVARLRPRDRPDRPVYEYARNITAARTQPNNTLIVDGDLRSGDRRE